MKILPEDKSPGEFYVSYCTDGAIEKNDVDVAETLFSTTESAVCVVSKVARIVSSNPINTSDIKPLKN